MGKTIFGVKNIIRYLEVSKDTYYKLVEEWLPVKRGPGGVRAHTDLLDSYFKEDIQQNSPSDSR